MKPSLCTPVSLPILLLLIALGIGILAPAHATTTLNRAGLVIRLSDEAIITRCVSFSEAQISGAVLLERAEVTIEVLNDPAMGFFVCGIAGVGCPASNCMCAYPDATWGYWLRQTSGWRSSPVGASSRTVRPGDVDGWLWGQPSSSNAAPLPDLSFTAICGPAAQWQVWLPLIRR
ncbi:MAG: hypothetical protein EI684_09670 [Candidatus Viridilinea halotolerans]|uniref:Uncharacterized protein n=1 Tax=Candidatus Viridilinea halotolerans TaxID=2491704 RepID=A0A426U0Y3_9CHLR|nr:MAG: hypothetical protein EI684_09670 [Candidatus Viridilinea halotolerans]